MRTYNHEANEDYFINRNDYRDSEYHVPATPKQIEFLDLLGVQYPNVISKGMASDLIDRALSDRAKAESGGGLFWALILTLAAIFIVACVIYGQLNIK